MFLIAASTSRATSATWMIVPAEPESDELPRSMSSSETSMVAIAVPAVAAMATASTKAALMGTARLLVMKMMSAMI
jgi:hypothetical protein